MPGFWLRNWDFGAKFIKNLTKHDPREKVGFRHLDAEISLILGRKFGDFRPGIC